MASVIDLNKTNPVYAGFTFATDIENARCIALGAMGADLENFVGAAPATATLATDMFAITATVPIDAVEPDLENAFTLTAGKIGRALILRRGQVFTMTRDAVDGTPVVGEYLIPQDGSTQWAPSATIGAAAVSLRVETITKSLAGTATAVRVTVVKA